MEKYTLLVNELMVRVSQTDDFKQRQSKGTIVQSSVEKICKPLQDEPRFEGLSSRFYTSATLLVTYTYKSWLELQQKRLWQLNGKKRWLKAVEDDFELAKVTDFSPQQVQAKAQKVLEEFERKQASKKRSSKELSQGKSPENEDSSDNGRLLFTFLFQKLSKEKKHLNRRAIVHLLKNEGQVNQDEENQEQLLLKLAERREEINRLEEQLEGSLPKGRDITNERAARLLEEAVDFLPRHTTRKPLLFLFTVFLAFVVEEVDYVKYGFYLLESIVKEAEIVQAEFFAWEDSVFEHFVNIAKVPNPLPYPVIFGSTGDIYWSSFERKERGIDSNNQQNSEARKVENKKRKCPPKRRREKLKTRSNQRIVVSFKGFGEKIFKVQCDRRQLPAFRQFLADWETLQRQKKEEKFSLGLFALRSAYLI